MISANEAMFQETKTSLFERKLTFEMPLLPSDINYFLIDTIDYKPDSLSEKNYTKLYDALMLQAKSETEEKYGVHFKQFNLNVPFEKNKINYFLIGLLDPSKIDLKLKLLLRQLRNAPNSRVNIAAVYDAEQANLVSSKIIKLDKTLGINTIYQDNHVQLDRKKYLTISKIDAADNMVCETFRVKYKAVRKDNMKALVELQKARDEAWGDVQKMMRIYKKHKLWHRSPIDGAFMFLTKYGWLTTATRTPKNDVTMKDMTLIKGFDEQENTITFVGDRLPSSDLPEFLVLVDRNEEALREKGESTPVIKYMAHFHKNEITRNPEYLKLGVPFSRYGVFSSGHTFADEILLKKKAKSGVNINGKGRGFIILEHGLVRMGVKLSHLEDFIKGLLPNQMGAI